MKEIIESAWESRAEVNLQTQGEIRDAVNETLNAINSGELRVAEPSADGWIVNEWAKKAMLNTANAGKFSSDRTIEEYASEIWKLDKVEVLLPEQK